MPLYIGYHGENYATGVDINLAGVLPAGWGAALLLRRPGEGKPDEYEAVSTLTGSILHVTFTTFDTALEGYGEATIEFRGPNGEKQKSDTAPTVISHALDLGGVLPERPELYRPAAAQDVIDAGKLSKAAQAEKTEEMTQPVGVDDDGKLWTLPGGKKPYLSFERVSRYLYNVSFAEAPDVDSDFVLVGGCSAYVQDGKLFRNLDWSYDHEATFHVKLPGIEGLSFMAGLTDIELDDELIAQLPYRMVDGVNEHGIMMSTHVLYNDWDAHGHGTIPLTRLPYIVLSRVKSMATIEDDLDGVLDNLVTTPSIDAMEYLIQVLVTDGTTTYVLRPGNAFDGTYEAVDISENAKLSNFLWVADETVTRQQLQNRPTGVERWNMMPCSLEDLRFTKAYEESTRLSEFIGLRGTTKDSTDAELTEIYETAHEMYEDRERDGSLWQTMHSVVYSSKGLEHLWIQEDWEKDYIASAGGGGSSDELWKPTVDANGNISWQKSTSSTPPTTQNIKGQQGAAGRDGADGQDGRDGADGHSPEVTATKSGKVTTIKVDDVAIATINDGNDGADGQDGRDGAPGADGITPTIGNNGNWFLGNTDTGKPSRGEQGTQGTPGAPGAPGAAGADGKSAYASAQDGGYTGTETQFNSDLAVVSNKQAKITVSGVLQGDGQGGVTAKTVDTAPTEGSEHLVTSGGVEQALTDLSALKVNKNKIVVNGIEYTVGLFNLIYGLPYQKSYKYIVPFLQEVSQEIVTPHTVRLLEQESQKYTDYGDYTANETFLFPTDPTLDGYVFRGWQEKGKSDAPFYKASDTFVIPNKGFRHTFIAYWTQENSG